jgi:hypothetical protein
VSGGSLAGIESLQGSTHNNILIRDNGSNELTGRAGSDHLDRPAGDGRCAGTASAAATSART